MSGESKMKSTRDLINEFEESIASSTNRIREFVRRNNEGWEQVNILTQQLKGLIEQLKSCLARLIGLKDFYLEFLGRLRSLKERQEERLSGEMRKLEKSGDEECRKQIQGLLTQFRTFISSFNQLEVGTTEQLKQQIDGLNAEIQRLCNDSDGIIKQMEANRGDIESVFDLTSAGNESGEAVMSREEKAPVLSRMERTAEISSDTGLGDRFMGRGGFLYGKKLSRKKKIRSISNLKKKQKKQKEIFNKTKKKKNKKKKKTKKKHN